MIAFSQTPPIEPGVSHDLAIWRASHYSDIRYKLNLTLEKMSPVLKGTIEIRVKVEESGSGGGKETAAPMSEPGAVATGFLPAIILDWRKLSGNEKLSTISNVSINGTPLKSAGPVSPSNRDGYFEEFNEHLIFRNGVVAGQNVIKLDFTSPILTSGSSITRYVDKEDGAEYIYSLFVPSDASTAFPVFDQPDLKARFTLSIVHPDGWKTISNTQLGRHVEWSGAGAMSVYEETKPISTYVFAFAAGPWAVFDDMKVISSRPEGRALPGDPQIYVRSSQAIKFGAHSGEVFRLTREGIKYLETYFDYKFPWPKYDLVLIPEFPFGGMEHAGATFLRESSVIFPTEPTRNDQISRANLIFHETAHQWFGDTVTMKWFDDLWLKEGFAEFMAYKTLEKVMPEANAWKVFYERNKQAAYQTDSTKGTTPIYQEIANLSAAKSAYGNIVYRKAPSFLRQAEFYLGEDKFQTAVRSFLKKHEFANAGWEDLVAELEMASNRPLKEWGRQWVKQPGMPLIQVSSGLLNIWQKPEVLKALHQPFLETIQGQRDVLGSDNQWAQRFKAAGVFSAAERREIDIRMFADKGDDRRTPVFVAEGLQDGRKPLFIIPNYGDYGYGIFLLDDKSRDYVLKNIQNEKDPFLRTMMWGSLWDSVREAELDPRDYVELVVKNLATEQDESTIQTLLGRVATATNYYISAPPAAAGRVSSPTLRGGGSARRSNGTAPSLTVGLQTRLESVLIDRIQNAPTAGQRITFYRALLGIASTERARDVLKQILKNGSKGGNPSGSEDAPRNTQTASRTLLTGRVSASGPAMNLKTKDRFDIVTRLIILGDPEAPKLLADLEKTETGDDAKRYAYAAKAGAATAENKAKFWNDFLTNKDISESWIEAAMGPFNSIRHASLTQQYLERALAELPNLKRSRKIFFVNGWLGAFIGGQRDEKALAIVNKFLADNPDLDKDLRLKILENVDIIERAVKIRTKYTK